MLEVGKEEESEEIKVIKGSLASIHPRRRIKVSFHYFFAWFLSFKKKRIASVTLE